jgi:competence protein ComFC
MRVGSAFEYAGPAASLILQMKFGKKPELAKDIAAWMVVQFFRLELPLPDLIVPVPQSFFRRMTRGYNQSELIAQEIGKLLERPVENILKRSIGDFPQTGKSREERENLLEDSFSLKKRFGISDKIILVIDDVMTTGSTLTQCARVLEEGFPAALFALTCCTAE